jgi:hypothetical protein
VSELFQELRAKWQRYGARLARDDGDGSLVGAAFIIAKTGVTDVEVLLAEVTRLQAKLDAVRALALDALDVHGHTTNAEWYAKQILAALDEEGM